MYRQPDDYRMQTIEAVCCNSSLLQTMLGALQTPKVQSKVYYPNITYKHQLSEGFTAVFLAIYLCWDVMLCHWVSNTVSPGSSFVM